MVRCLGAGLLLGLIGCVSVTPPAGSRDGAATTGGDGGGFSTERVIGSAPLGDAACVTQTQQAETLPLDMYVMMDSSASMDEPTAGGMSKWDAVRAAVIAFLDDPQSAGLGVGLQYFPIPRAGVPDQCATAADCGAFGPCKVPRACSGGPGLRLCELAATCGPGRTCDVLGICSVSFEICTLAGAASSCLAAEGTCLPFFPYCEQRDSCEAATYSTPAVPVAALPAAAPALVASLMAHEVDGFTPTSAALSGGLAHARARAIATPGRRVVLVLATDGLPSECAPTDITGVAALAAAGHAGAPSVPTFVIGVFAPAEQAVARPNLDALAQAGGTQQALVISTGQNVTQAFQAALGNVRAAALACEYSLPTAVAGRDGGQLDYFSVNVQFRSGAGQAVTIGNVRDRTHCHPTQGGWYYDVDPASGATPKTISVCDNTCAQFRADVAGKVEVLLGCKTEVIVL